jgi:hypothetical protein
MKTFMGFLLLHTDSQYPERYLVALAGGHMSPFFLLGANSLQPT